MKCTNTCQNEEPEIVEGLLVYLSLKYVGPWKVLQAWPETSTYWLELPAALQEHHIHPRCHVVFKSSSTQAIQLQQNSQPLLGGLRPYA